MSPKSYIIPMAIVAAGVGWMVSKPMLEKRDAVKTDAVAINVVHTSVALDDWCRESAPRSGGWYCEVREFTLPGGSFGGVASANGNIQVEAWDKGEVFVRAKIEGRARSQDAARELVSGVSLTTEDILKANGPRQGRGSNWSVSYIAMVPAKSDLTVSATNGNVTVTSVTGDLNARSTNGNVQLRQVGGDVSGGTTNGNVKVELAGQAWVGDGVDVRTTNGSIELDIPADYNGVLEAATVNGSINVDFPVTVTGKISKQLHAVLGDGGALIKAATTNGSVRIRKQ